MEDQPADSGDLTTGAAAPVPQGKSARTRHRLPKQKLRQEGQDDTAGTSAETAIDEVVEEAVATETAVEPETAEPETAEPEAAVVEPAASRRRFGWRRSKTAQPPVTQAAEAPEVAESVDAEPESSTDTTEPDATVAADTEPAEATNEAGVEPDEPVVLVPHRTAGRVLKVAAVIAGVLFVGAAAFAGATMQPYLADRATAHTKFEIAETAAKAITTLWTYTPEDMDALPERAGKFLSGDFASEYRRYIDAIVETNKQAQVTNNTQVLGAAVESLTPTEASAIVYTNSVATSPVTKGIPSLRYLSYRLTMVPRNHEWLITKMTAVTSLDLTPKF